MSGLRVNYLVAISTSMELLNKVIWCLQIQEESLKTLLLVVCVLSSSLWIVNSLFKMIQG